MRRIAALAATATIAPLLAFGAETPVLRPRRDVDVLYNMVPNGRPETHSLHQRARWDVKAQRLRIDLPSPGTWMLVDFAGRRMAMVSDPARKVVRLAGGDARLPGEVPGDDYTRQDTDSVAGLPCTDWSTRDRAGHPVVVCITADGVLLRVQAGPKLLAQALRVTYGPQDPAAFAVPAGYAEVTPSVVEPHPLPPSAPASAPASVPAPIPAP